MYQAVIFDLDGTLLDTLQDLAMAGNHALSALGLPTHPIDAYRKIVGGGISELVRLMLPAQNTGDATLKLARSLFKAYYTAHMQDFTAPFPGIVPLLGTLKQHGVRLGLNSNKDDAPVQEMVRAYFPGLFDAVAGLREGVLPKPDPAGAAWLVGQLQAAPGDTLYVGDSDVDVFTAVNAGLDCCGVLWGFRGGAELKSAGAHYLVENTAQLQSLILAEH